MADNRLNEIQSKVVLQVLKRHESDCYDGGEMDPMEVFGEIQGMLLMHNQLHPQIPVRVIPLPNSLGC